MVVTVEGEEAVATFVSRFHTRMATAPVSLPTRTPLLRTVTCGVPGAECPSTTPTPKQNHLVETQRLRARTIIAPAARSDTARLSTMNGNEVPLSFSIGDYHLIAQQQSDFNSISFQLTNLSLLHSTTKDWKKYGNVVRFPNTLIIAITSLPVRGTVTTHHTAE